MKWLGKIEEGLLGLGLISVTIVLMINVFLRYLFNSSIVWAEEYIRYSMIWITFVGASVCFRRGVHVGVEFIFTLIPRQATRLLRLLLTLLSIVFMALLFKYGLDLTLFSFDTNQISAALQIPLGWIYMAIPAGALLSIIHLLIISIQLIKGGEEREDESAQNLTNLG